MEWEQTWSDIHRWSDILPPQFLGETRNAEAVLRDMQAELPDCQFEICEGHLTLDTTERNPTSWLREAVDTSALPDENKLMGLKARSTNGRRSKALHKRAQTYNWDLGEDGLERILADSACDYGTALLIFWMGAPGFDRQYATIEDVDSWRRGTFQFLRRLETRLSKRDFVSSSILFNPQFDCTTISHEGHDWTSEYGEIDVKHATPPALYEPSCSDPEWEKRNRRPKKNTANRLT